MLRVARWIQRTLFAIGFVILGYCCAAWTNSRLAQYLGDRELSNLQSDTTPVRSTDAHLTTGSLIGKVEIEKLHLSAVVFQGTDDSVLDRGVGHVEETPLPGQSGNVVLAAHRDTFFRGLRNISKGDIVRVTTPRGERTYAVESTRIVNPDQTSVMDPTPSPALTLITCYPFYYVGHAPKRFIVRAIELGSPQQSQPDQQLVAAREAARMSSGRPTVDKENLTYRFSASE